MEDLLSMKKITEFRGEYFFLSNFYECPVTWNGLTFRNSEAAFQSAKAPESMKESFTFMTAEMSKRVGRSVSLPIDWEQKKESIMREILICKFTQNEDIKQGLMDTGDAVLIEGNTWGDKYWGMCYGIGKNRLGNILMEIRTMLREGKVGS